MVIIPGMIVLFLLLLVTWFLCMKFFIPIGGKIINHVKKATKQDIKK